MQRYRVAVDIVEDDDDMNGPMEVHEGGVSCGLRLSHLPPEQLHTIMKVDLIVANKGIYVRAIIINFDLDIYSACYERRTYL